jgi:hypothetical protein
MGDIQIPLENTTFPISDIIRYLKSVLNTNSKYLDELRKTRSEQILRKNKYIMLDQKLKKMATDISAASLTEQELNYIYTNIYSDSIAAFGDNVFKRFMANRKMNAISIEVKNMERELRRINNIKFSDISALINDNLQEKNKKNSEKGNKKNSEKGNKKNSEKGNKKNTKKRNKNIKYYIIEMSKYKYSSPYATNNNGSSKYRPEDDEPIPFITYTTRLCKSNEINKILKHASYDIEYLFEFIRSKIADTLRQDIVWEKRKYEIWYKLRKLNQRIIFLNTYIKTQELKCQELKCNLDLIVITEIDPQYIKMVSNTCKLLNKGINIAEDYTKIKEFAQWASEYGRNNLSDPDITDAVEWVQLRANEQLYILHTDLLNLRNNLDLPNTTLFY